MRFLLKLAIASVLLLPYLALLLALDVVADARRG